MYHNQILINYCVKQLLLIYFLNFKIKNELINNNQ